MVQELRQCWPGSTFGADRGSNWAPNNSQSTPHPSAQAQLEASGRTILHQKPSRSKAGSQAPRAEAMQCSIRVVPKPLRSVGESVGPPVSSQKMLKSFAPLVHSIWSFPVGTESAPYLTALVRSSCTMRIMLRTCSAGSITSVPRMTTCSDATPSSSFLNIVLSGAPRGCSVRRSFVLRIASKRRRSLSAASGSC